MGCHFQILFHDCCHFIQRWKDGFDWPMVDAGLYDIMSSKMAAWWLPQVWLRRAHGLSLSSSFRSVVPYLLTFGVAGTWLRVVLACQRVRPLDTAAHRDVNFRHTARSICQWTEEVSVICRISHCLSFSFQRRVLCVWWCLACFSQ